MLKYSAGKALAWLKKNSELGLGAKGSGPIREAELGPIKNGSTFTKAEGKSQINSKKGQVDTEEGDTLKITAVYDNGTEFKAQLNSKFGVEQVLISKTQLSSGWNRTK
jgi:hypothetical protein